MVDGEILEDLDPAAEDERGVGHVRRYLHVQQPLQVEVGLHFRVQRLYLRLGGHVHAQVQHDHRVTQLYNKQHVVYQPSDITYMNRFNT